MLYPSWRADIIYASAESLFSREYPPVYPKCYLMLDEVDETFARTPYHLVRQPDNKHVRFIFKSHYL